MFKPSKVQRRKRLRRSSNWRKGYHRKQAQRSAEMAAAYGPARSGESERSIDRKRETVDDRIARQRAFRNAVLESAGHECQRCAGLFHLQAHHFLPKSRGGQDDPANGICLCADCHRGVHDHTIEDWAEWIDSRKGRAA